MDSRQPMQRQDPRYHTTLLVRCIGEQDMREHRGDVSAGGFCFEARYPTDPGKVVDVLFRLPGAGFWLRGQGVVLGSTERGDKVAVRCRFTRVDLRNAGALDGWIQSMALSSADVPVPPRAPAGGCRRAAAAPAG